MPDSEIHVVTGAFGYTGRYIARRLLDAGHDVSTLTNSPDREHPFGERIEAHGYHFDEPERLVASLRGTRVLYNTYWVRFNHRDFTHGTAVENTLVLFEAARAAGVERVVHVSITNPSEDSPFEYFRGKAQLEKALVASGLSYAILRPTVVFGREDILVNNIAWVLRRLPVFGVFGDGSYRLQPIYAGDLARLAVEEGALREDRVVDAIGPETFTYRGLVEAVARALGKTRWIVPMPPRLGYAFGQLLGRMVGDVLVTREEIDALMADLLHTDSPSAGDTRLTTWLGENVDALGVRYHSELARRRDRQAAYERL